MVPSDSSNMLRRKTIAVDFDGVLAEYDGWKGDDQLGSPRMDVVKVLKLLRQGMEDHCTYDPIGTSS